MQGPALEAARWGGLTALLVLAAAAGAYMAPVWAIAGGALAGFVGLL
jgi:hypothetical protein